MNISAWAIKNPIPSILLFILLTIAGIVSFSGLHIAKFPDMDYPWVTIVTVAPGMSSNQIESEVTRKIENAVATVDGVRETPSSVGQGYTRTVIIFEMEKNLTEGIDELKEAVARIRSNLPKDIQEPIISRTGSSGGVVLTYGVTAKNMDELDLSWLLDEKISKSVLSVQGVGHFLRLGGLEREVAVDLDPKKMVALNISASEVSTQLANSYQDIGSGYASLNDHKQIIKTQVALNNLETLKKTVLTVGQGPYARSIRLSDIATIRDQAAERTPKYRFKGQSTVAFEIARAKNASEIEVAAAVREKVKALRLEYPNLEFTEIYDATGKVLDAYHASMQIMLEGAILAVVVVLLFLRDWRATLISAVALPLSIIPTFLVMQYLGFTLNIITLLALALVIGVLVDDAIVEVENIMRHLQMGKSPLEAAKEAADEIGLAVIATSVTLMAIFLPTAFMPGIAGKFFTQFGITAAVAVLFSLLVARLLTPMMAAYGLKVDLNNHHAKPDSWLMQKYLAFVRSCVAHPWITMFLTTLFFVGSMLLVPYIPKTFFPTSDEGKIVVRLESAPGSTFDHIDKALRNGERLLKNIPEISSVYSSSGLFHESNGAYNSLGIKDLRKGEMVLQLTPEHERIRKQVDIEQEIRMLFRALPGIRIKIGSGMPGERYTLRLLSNNPSALNEVASKIQRDMRTIKGVGTTSSTAPMMSPELIIQPRPEQAANLGVSNLYLGHTIRVATSGDFEQFLPKLNLPNRQVPIRVRLNKTAREDMEAIKQLRVPGKMGMVPLGNVADIIYSSGAAEITRDKRERSVVLNLELNGRPLAEVDQQVRNLPSVKQLPKDVRISESGETQAMQEIFTSFGLAMFFGILTVYMVLVLLFKGFSQPITVLSAMPLSVGGALGMLLVTGNSMSLPTLIGLLMLMGVVTKNSILIIDYIIISIEAGMTRFDAIVDACRKRAQPIIMTTCAMALGMLPIALGYGADSSFRKPMAIVVIGGLLTSTVLSLVVVPVIYLLMDDLVKIFKKKPVSALVKVMDTN